MHSGQGKKILIIVTVIAGLVVLEGIFRGRIFKNFFKPTGSDIPIGVTLKELSETNVPTTTIAAAPKKDVEVLAENLEIPWDIAFLPDGDLLVTERPGKVLKVGSETKIITEIAGVEHRGEGGLLGITLHPDFSTNRYVYLYLTVRENGNLKNRIERYVFENNKLTNKQIVLDNLDGAVYHDGGRIDFGPDGNLYVTAGDAQIENDAQNTSSLSGKILRITEDGKPASGNSFGNEVYSYGHRNPQGFAWDKNGNLWSSEHGPSGTQTGNDEINFIVNGGNYGWPQIKGTQTADGMFAPIIESGKNDTWAPASIAYYKDYLFFGGLRGESLYQVKIEDSNKLSGLKANFKGEFGRIRTVRIGPDGYLYLTTSNRDGRGTVSDGDDKIIRINPEIFFR